MRIWRHGRETDSDAAMHAIAFSRMSGAKLVLTNGCFAAIHAGHIATIRAAAQHRGLLIVAFNTAESVTRLKGHAAILPDEDRGAMLSALDCVDYAITQTDDTPHALLARIRPTVLFKGGTTQEIVGREYVESYFGKVETGPRIEACSATEILRDI